MRRHVHLGILPVILLLGAILGSVAAAGDTPPAVHGMLLFGREKFYLVPLARLQAPHDYRLVLVAELDEAQRNAVRRDMQQNPSAYYTIETARMSLSRVVRNMLPFPARIYRGHHARPAERVAVLPRPVTFTPTEELFPLERLPNAAAPADFQYALFGTTGDAYLVHLTSVARPIVQVLSVLGPRARPPAGRTETIEVAAELREADRPLAGALTVQRQLYLERLGMP